MWYSSWRRRLALLAPLFICAASAAVSIIDCGSAADRSFVGGNPWVVSTPTSDTTLRFGPTFRYPIQVPPGRYSVTLRFIEPSVNATGQRIFSVSINGALVIDRLDLVAVAGLLKAYSRTVESAAPNGILDIAFSTQVRSAVISAIEYTQLADNPPPTEQTIRTGFGLLSYTVGNVMTVQLDSAYVMIVSPADEPVPVIGDGCQGGMFIGQTAVYFCAPILPLSANPSPWGRWIRLVAQ